MLKQNLKNGNLAEFRIIEIIGNQGELLEHNKYRGIDLKYKFGNRIINIEVKSAIRNKKSYKNAQFLIYNHQIYLNDIFAFVIYDIKGFVYHLFVFSLNLYFISNKLYHRIFKISERQIKLYCYPKINIKDLIQV